MRRSWPITVLLFGLAASCGNLTCDENKKESLTRMNAGVEHAQTSSFASAEKELELATTLDPTNHAAAFNLGTVYVTQKKWDKAVDAFAAAVKFNDSDPMYHYHLGHSYFEVGKLDMARPELEKALSLQKRLFKAHYFLGRIHAEQDRPKEAASEWGEACRLNPGFGKPFSFLGKLYYKWDYFQEAVAVLEQGAKYTRDADDLTDVYYYLGMSYDMLKQHDKAIEAYKNALDAKRDNIEAGFQLGLSYAEKGDKVNAKKQLEDFVKQGGGGKAFLVQAANDRMMKLSGE
jgi:tetratricopeptide (TPR) repeat protein